MTHDEATELAAGYVLHALEPDEDAAVREHLGTCALPHPEFEELGGVVPALLELDPSELVEPPAGLRDRILAAAASDVARADARPSGSVPPAFLNPSISQFLHPARTSIPISSSTATGHRH